MVWLCPTKCSSQSKKDWKGLVPLPHILPPPTAGWCGCKREEQSPKTGSTTLCCLQPAQPTSSVDETAAAFADETRNDTSQSSGHLRDARDPVSCEGRARLERAGADQRGGLPQVFTSKITITIVIVILFANLTLVPIRITRSWAS